MGRIFRRGELKQAIVVVLAVLGDAHGYAIMSELEARVEGGWKASPGAIYPALLALVESGHLRTEEKDGVRVYSLTDTGRQAADNAGWERRWGMLTERAEESEERMAIGSMLDVFRGELADETASRPPRTTTGDRVDPRTRPSGDPTNA
jgi:DNA-binding PadR family transcriptional regulator